MFNILVSILAVLGGLVAILCVALGIAYFILARRLTHRMRETVGEMEAILAQSIAAVRTLESRREESHHVVPPMRIDMQPVDANDRFEAPIFSRISAWLQEHSFSYVGDFAIQQLSEYLRLYLSDDTLLVAALRMQQAGGEYYLEFCCDLGGGRRGGVGNPPIATVGLPPDAVGKFFSGSLEDNFDLLSRMWLDAKEIVDQHDVYAVDPDQMARFFEEAHAAEMDERLVGGGVTEAEIRESFAAQGQVASAEDIGAIQSQWQAAIEEHLIHCSRRGDDHAALGQPILVVHDNSLGGHLLDRVSSLLQTDQRRDVELADIESELRELLDRFSPRDAIARLRPLLPHDVRYDLIDQLTQPIAADLYAFPANK